MVFSVIYRTILLTEFRCHVSNIKRPPFCAVCVAIRKLIFVSFCCRISIRNGLRLRGEDLKNRMQGRRINQVNSRELRKIFNNHLQRPWKHRLERQLHVAKVPKGPPQQVNILRFVKHSVFRLIHCDYVLTMFYVFW